MKFLNILLLILAAQAASAQIKVVKLSEKDVPKNMKFEGGFEQAMQYTDKEGTHVVITSEAVGGDDEDQRTGYVYAYNYLEVGSGVKLVWKLYDYTATCGEDVEAEFEPNTFSISDFNHNGIAEVWLMYFDACKGDVSPSELKVIMHEGIKKYAMRGTTRVKVNATDHVGGSYAFDDAFNAAPAAFREYAKQLWKKNVNEDHFY